MGPVLRPRVKICCMMSVDEMLMAVRHGASAVGLVSDMPSGPGVIPEDRIGQIARRVPPGVASFLLTCRAEARQIVEQQRRCGTSVVQICDRLERGTYDELRREMPGIGIVQVIHVTGEESIDEARQIALQVDAILLDSGNQKLQVKELGGTGRRHDWGISRRIREAIDKPLYLAGGLRPENVAEAIETVRPFGLDLCGGVRCAGRLDEQRVSAFMQAVAGASGRM